MGDSAEKLFFESSNWKFDGSNRCAYLGNHKVTIMKSFAFRSDQKRMSTIVKVDGINSYFNGKYIVTKGAPEIIQNYLATIPQNYIENSEGFMKDGYRVMALAYRKLKGNEEEDVKILI